MILSKILYSYPRCGRIRNINIGVATINGSLVFTFTFIRGWVRTLHN